MPKNDPKTRREGRNLLDVVLVLGLKKFEGKFCDFGAMITKGVRNERDDLA